MPTAIAASCGATRCTTGRRCSAAATAGGPSACAARFALFDVTRIDHFRGFVAYWAVPEGAPDARGGRWRRGPGRAVFDAAARELGPLPLIAEDLGVITEPVERLRRSLGFPGMVVMQFGFDPDDPHGPHRLENHEHDSVVYTGTHDHDTLRGWWSSLAPATRAAAASQIAAGGFEEPEPWWSMIRLAYSSPARLAMIQAQDVLGLGSEARMNIPGRATGSWRWRMQPGALTASWRSGCARRPRRRGGRRPPQAAWRRIASAIARRRIAAASSRRFGVSRRVEHGIDEAETRVRVTPAVQSDGPRRAMLWQLNGLYPPVQLPQPSRGAAAVRRAPHAFVLIDAVRVRSQPAQPRELTRAKPGARE